MKLKGDVFVYLFFIFRVNARNLKLADAYLYFAIHKQLVINDKKKYFLNIFLDFIIIFRKNIIVRVLILLNNFHC